MVKKIIRIKFLTIVISNFDLFYRKLLQKKKKDRIRYFIYMKCRSTKHEHNLDHVSNSLKEKNNLSLP